MPSDRMVIECFRGQGGAGWFWRLKGRNGAILADSAEGYPYRGRVEKAAQRLLDAGLDAELRFVG